MFVLFVGTTSSSIFTLGAVALLFVRFQNGCQKLSRKPILYGNEITDGSECAIKQCRSILALG